MGKVIGKQGRTARAFKRLNAASTKIKKRSVLEVSNNPNTLIHLGFLGKTHGLAGEITFYPMHRKDCQLHAKMEVFLKKDASDKFEPHSLEKLRWSSQFALVSFQKLTGIDLVKPFREVLFMFPGMP